MTSSHTMVTPVRWLGLVVFLSAVVMGMPFQASGAGVCQYYCGEPILDSQDRATGDWTPNWEEFYDDYHIRFAEEKQISTSAGYFTCDPWSPTIGFPDCRTECEYLMDAYNYSLYFPRTDGGNSGICWAAGAQPPDPYFYIYDGGHSPYQYDGAGNAEYLLDGRIDYYANFSANSLCGLPNGSPLKCVRVLVTTYDGLYYQDECQSDLECGVDSADYCGVDDDGKPAVLYDHHRCGDDGPVKRCVTDFGLSRKNCSAYAGNGACDTDVITGQIISGNVCINGDTRGFNTTKGVCYLDGGKPSCGPTLDQANVPYQRCVETPGTYSYDYGDVTCVLSIYYNPMIPTPCYQQGQCGITGCRGVLSNHYCYVNAAGPGEEEENVEIVDSGCPDGQTRPYWQCSGKTCSQVDACGVNTCSPAHQECTGGSCQYGAQYGPNDCSTCGGTTDQNTNYFSIGHWYCSSTTCSQVADTCDQCPEGQTKPHSQCVGGTCTSVNTCGVTNCETCQPCPDGQTYPYYRCIGGTCSAIYACGVTDCATCQQGGEGGGGGEEGGCLPGQTNPYSTCSAETPNYYPLAYWKFHTGSGTTVTDSSGYGNSGTILGGVTYSSSTPALQSVNPHSLNFPGTQGSYVSTQNIGYGGYGITITAWVKANAGTYGYIVNKNYDGTNVPFSLNVGGNNSPNDLDGMAVFYGGSWKNSGLGGVDIRGDGQFHFIAGVYNPTVTNKLRYYVDGVLRGSSTEVPVYLAVSNSSPVDIGTYRNDNQYFSGIIDEVAIYNRALTDADIAALATGTSPTGSGGTCDIVNACGTTNCANCTACPAGQTYPYATCAYGSCTIVNACGTTNCLLCNLPEPSCPAGETDPHITCVEGSCVQVSGCGSSDCSTCVAECPAGQSLPHNECINGTCASVDTCGVNDCSSCQQHGGPYVTGLSLSEVNCTGVQGEAMIALSWTYDDQLYDDTETSFEVQIDNNQNFNNPQFTKTTNASGPGNSQQVFIRNTNDVTGCNANLQNCYLTYGKAYYVRVRVTGTIGGAPATSSWYYHNGNGGTTVKNNQISYSRTGKPAPFPYFTGSPSSPKVDQPVVFADASVCYDGARNPHACSDILSSGYTWYFANEGQSNTVGSTSYVFSTAGSKTVTLQVCDDEHCCSYNRIVPVISNKGNLPNYKEVSPF